MRHSRLLAGISLTLFFGGCATSSEDLPPDQAADTGARADTGAAKVDTGTPVVVDDTGSAPEDTGSVMPTDTGTTVVDTSMPTDTGSMVDSIVPIDTAVGDTSGDAGVVTGTRIYTGTLTLRGVTSDNYAIVTDSSAAAWAVPLGGGAATSIGAGAERVRVIGRAVFVWGAVNTTYNYGTLRVWTAANGTKSISTKSLAPSTTSVAGLFVAAASADGTSIAYTDNFVESATADDKADLVVAKSDGTGVKKVFTQYVTYDSASLGEACAPFMFWVGTRFVTTHCTPGTTADSFDLSSIDPSTGTATSLATDLKTYFTNNDAGTMVAVATGSTNALKVVPVTGGAGTVIDTSATSFSFSHDGSFIVYRTSTNALKRSTTASAAPTTLVATGVAGLLSGISPDDKHILVASATPTTAGSDIKLASVVTAGAPVTLYSGTNGEVYGTGFTSDSTHALWYGGVMTPGVGTLTATPTAGGANVVLGSAAWQDYAAGGAKVVWNDTHVTVGSGGRATIRARNLGTASSMTTTIAASADRTFVLDAAMSRIVYTLSVGSASDGLYVASVP